jgi:hypothetical protein
MNLADIPNEDISLPWLANLVVRLIVPSAIPNGAGVDADDVGPGQTQEGGGVHLEGGEAALELLRRP